MLANPRRTLIYSLALLGSSVLLLLAVGKHDSGSAPATTLPVIGAIDAHVQDWTGTIRFGVLTAFCRFLNVFGAGLVTVPIRAAASLVLIVHRRWRAFASFALTWLVAQVSFTLLKLYFHRGRPPGPLVAAGGYSLPSGHAVAAAATAAALVLVFARPGAARRNWAWVAVSYALVMALSRVYLEVHWLSDTVTGVLLGWGIALAAAAITELWRAQPTKMT